MAFDRLYSMPTPAAIRINTSTTVITNQRRAIREAASALRRIASWFRRKQAVAVGAHIVETRLELVEIATNAIAGCLQEPVEAVQVIVTPIADGVDHVGLARLGDVGRRPRQRRVEPEAMLG